MVAEGWLFTNKWTLLEEECSIHCKHIRIKVMLSVH